MGFDSLSLIVGISVDDFIIQTAYKIHSVSYNIISNIFYC